MSSDVAEQPLALGVLRRVGAALQRLPRAWWGLVAVAWMGGIAVLSSMPSSDMRPPPVGALVWNLGHAFLYGMLALWLALAVPRASGWPRLDQAARFLVFAVVVGYGAFDEWRQASAPGRDASAFDLLTDYVGAWCVLWIAAYVPQPAARTAGLLARLAVCVVLCVAAAALATWNG